MFKRNLILILSFLLPIVARAQADEKAFGVTCPKRISTLADVFNFFTCLLTRAIVPLLFAAAWVVFIWGVVLYIAHGGDEAKRKKGIQFIVWGIIGLFIMVSIWAIIGILMGTFDFGTTVVPQLQD